MSTKRKSGKLRDVTDEELIAELARRRAEKLPEDFTMTDIELAVHEMNEHGGPPSVAAMLSRMKPEKPTAKACPRCGKRIPVRARDRERAPIPPGDRAGQLGEALAAARGLAPHQGRERVGRDTRKVSSSSAGRRGYPRRVTC